MLTEQDKSAIWQLMEDWSRKNGGERQHRGAMTRLEAAILRCLLEYDDLKIGRGYTSYRDIAAKAECARSSVGLTILNLRKAGLVHRDHMLLHYPLVLISTPRLNSPRIRHERTPPLTGPMRAAKANYKRRLRGVKLPPPNRALPPTGG
jgi:hypothetical protein